MKYIEMKNTLQSKLQIYSTRSIRISSVKQDMFEKLQQFNFNPSVVVFKIGMKIKKRVQSGG